MSLVNNNNSNNSIGVGNFKGVMLCNRPFAGSVATSGRTSSSEKTSFSCGVVSEGAGMNVSISNLEKKYPKRKKKETALTKHRKWLAELQNTKDRLESQYEDELRAAQAKNDKFQAREASVRQVSKGTLVKAESKPPGKSKKDKQAKPAWAMTQENAEVAQEEKELEDEDELMNFAKDLNFDKYIDDLEIKTMMDKVQKRILELEKASSEERIRDEEAEQRAVARAVMEAKGEIDPDMYEAEGKSDAYDEAYEAAKGLLAESDALKGVHSAKSVAQVYKSTKEAKGGDDKPAGEPKIVTHQNDDGARLENKNNPSNLPYIHRNPAV